MNISPSGERKITNFLINRLKEIYVPVSVMIKDGKKNRKKNSLSIPKFTISVNIPWMIRKENKYIRSKACKLADDGQTLIISARTRIRAQHYCFCLSTTPKDVIRLSVVSVAHKLLELLGLCLI